MLCLHYFISLVRAFFWHLRLLPGRIACWRMHFFREDIVCFVLSTSLYDIFRVCPIMDSIYGYCVLGFLLSQEVHYI
jgi:hypothetical protein